MGQNESESVRVGVIIGQSGSELVKMVKLDNFVPIWPILTHFCPSLAIFAHFWANVGQNGSELVQFTLTSFLTGSSSGRTSSPG